VTARLEVVEPARGRGETWVVIGVVAAVLAINAAVVSVRRVDTSPPRLFEWRIMRIRAHM
jgi:hypothetical protein